MRYRVIDEHDGRCRSKLSVLSQKDRQCECRPLSRANLAQSGFFAVRLANEPCQLGAETAKLRGRMNSRKDRFDASAILPEGGLHCPIQGMLRSQVSQNRLC